MMDVLHEAFGAGQYNSAGSEEFDDFEPFEEDGTKQYRTDSIFCIQKSTDRSHENKELRKFETYQNQRVWMGIFKEALFPHERAAWSDKEGTVKLPKESILLPVEGDWQWESSWQVEKDPQFQDRKGWSYANDFHGPFKRSRGLLDFVRRRKWVRYATLRIKPGEKSANATENTQIEESGMSHYSETNLDDNYFQRNSESKK